MNEVVVIGGGSSGMMAALCAAREGARVTLLEAGERLGKKLSMTGNGRCNFTNLANPSDAYRGGDPLFIKMVVSAFPPRETIGFFTQLGVYSRNLEGYLYPSSMQASQVTELFRMALADAGVKVKTRERVTSLEKCSRKSGGEGILVHTEGWKYEADHVILSCGSGAFPLGGGIDSYKLATGCGHTLIKPLPALCPLACEGVPAWGGVRVQGEVRLFSGENCLARDTGELQLTDYGISGIPVFNVSRYAIRAISEGRKVRTELNLMPDFTRETLKALLERRRKDAPYKSPKELLVGLFPDRLIPVLLKKGEEGLEEAIHAFSLKVKGGFGPERAQCFSGGIPLEEADPFTLESRKLPGLYLCGEVLDVDGRCGGYNLQWAWSSGHLAGQSAGRRRV